MPSRSTTKAVRLQPDFANAHLNLGTALFRKRLLTDAAAHYEKALAIAPQSIVILNKLALLLATCSDAQIRNGSRAIELAEKADRLSNRQSPEIVRTLAAAYAEGGRFTDAIDAAKRAQELALEQRNAALAGEIRMDVDLYRMNFPKRESGTDGRGRSLNLGSSEVSGAPPPPPTLITRKKTEIVLRDSRNFSGPIIRRRPAEFREKRNARAALPVLS